MMKLAAIVVLLVGPDIVLTTSLYSDIVADHENWCPPQGKHCLYGGYHPNVTTRCCGYCDCELEECSKYGTCCLNAYGSIDAARERISKSLYRCVNPSMYRYDEVKNPTQLIGYQLISVCNSSSPNPAIRDLCENPDVDTYLDTLFPIADHSSKLVYRNQYCALCDVYADLDKISRWFMDIKCNTTVALTYERMLHIIKERQCSVTFKEPMKYAIQSCIPYTISTCNETGQWRVYNETLDTACNSFVDPFNFTFKNVFCFLCNIDNREPIDLSNCADSMSLNSMASFSRKPPPFLAIRNLDAILTEQRSKQMQCKEHSQYRDDKLGVCRDIQCDRTQYLSFEGSCELNPELHKNQECYMMFLKHTPLYFRLLKSNVKSLMKQPMNVTDIEMYAKESDTNKRYVEYFIIKLLVEYLNYVKDAPSSFQILYGFDMLIELVSYNVSLFNGQSRIEVPNADSGGKISL